MENINCYPALNSVNEITHYIRRKEHRFQKPVIASNYDGIA